MAMMPPIWHFKLQQIHYRSSNKNRHPAFGAQKVPEGYEGRDGNKDRQGVDINGLEETERGGEEGRGRWRQL